MTAELSKHEKRRLIEGVRDACVEAALKGYERAALSGLCHEGAWESAVDAMRALDVDALLQALSRPRGD
ncbi:MAG: acetyltransferase [Acidobacteriia bacterium]|nr:acetyltransferase [Terriglobia bacterium]